MGRTTWTTQEGEKIDERKAFKPCLPIVLYEYPPIVTD